MLGGVRVHVARIHLLLELRVLVVRRVAVHVVWPVVRVVVGVVVPAAASWPAAPATATALMTSSAVAWAAMALARPVGQARPGTATVGSSPSRQMTVVHLTGLGNVFTLPGAHSR